MIDFKNKTVLLYFSLLSSLSLISNATCGVLEMIIVNHLETISINHAVELYSCFKFSSAKNCNAELT